MPFDSVKPLRAVEGRADPPWSCSALFADNCCDQCTQRQHQAIQLDCRCGLSELSNGLQYVHPELHTPGKAAE